MSPSWSPPPFCGMLPVPPPPPLPPPLLDAVVGALCALDVCAAGLLVGWLFELLDDPPHAVTRANAPANTKSRTLLAIIGGLLVRLGDTQRSD